MFESLLVPLDRSKSGEQSLPTAVALAGESGAALHLVHVHVPHVPDTLSSGTQHQLQRLDFDECDRMQRCDERRYLEKSAGRTVDHLPERPSVKLLDGPVPKAIHRFADQSGADLIVITRHSHEGASRPSGESVTEALARETTRPVLILRPEEGEAEGSKPTRFENVLVCLDGSDASETILEPVRGLGELGAHLTLLHVLSAQPSKLPDLHVDWLDGYLASVAREIEDHSPSVRIEVREARDPVTGILRTAKELKSDLIAFATEGRGCLHRVVLGSVAKEILRRSPLPVLLRRPPITTRQPRGRSTSPIPTAKRTSRRRAAPRSRRRPPRSLG